MLYIVLIQYFEVCDKHSRPTCMETPCNKVNETSVVGDFDPVLHKFP